MIEQIFDCFCKEMQVKPDGLDAQIFLYGAGEIGRKFWEKFQDHITILGFIDSDQRKQGGHIELDGVHTLTIYSLEKVRMKFPQAKIVITTTSFQEVMQTLNNAGYQENRDYYERRNFEILYHKAVDHILWFSFLALVVTERCSLRCQHCIHSAPYAKEYREIPVEEHMADCDALFHAVDRLGRLEVMGGEALLYRPLPKLLKHIGRHYRDRIEEYTITTNGTCPLTSELVEICRDYRIQVEISDYRNMIAPAQCAQVEYFLEELERNKITYLLRPQDQWINFGYQDPGAQLKDMDQLRERYAKCKTSCHALYRNRVYVCASEIGGVSAGWCTERAEDVVFLKPSVEGEREILRNRLMALDLGCPSNGYVSWCSRCRGYLASDRVPAAKQLG